MNRIKTYLSKVILILCVLGAVVLINPIEGLAEYETEDTEEPASVSEQEIRYVGSTDSTVTICWKLVEGADGYKICYKGDETSEQKTAETTESQITLTGLKNVYVCEGNIYAYRDTPDGRMYSENASFMGFPVKKPRVSNLKAELRSNKKKYTLDLSVKSDGSPDGYQYKVYDSKNKKIQSGTFNGSMKSISGKKIKSNQFYKITVCPYVKIPCGASKGEKIFGNRTVCRYAAKVVTDFKVKAKAIDRHVISWKKVPGATGYMVYTASKWNGKYKKLATTKKPSCTLKKFITKDLCIRIVPVKKVKGTTYKVGVTSGNYSGTIFPRLAFWFYLLRYSGIDSDKAHLYYQKNADTGQEYFY